MSGGDTIACHHSMQAQPRAGFLGPSCPAAGHGKRAIQPWWSNKFISGREGEKWGAKWLSLSLRAHHKTKERQDRERVWGRQERETEESPCLASRPNSLPLRLLPWPSSLTLLLCVHAVCCCFFPVYAWLHRVFFYSPPPSVVFESPPLLFSSILSSLHPAYFCSLSFLIFSILILCFFPSSSSFTFSLLLS